MDNKHVATEYVATERRKEPLIEKLSLEFANGAWQLVFKVLFLPDSVFCIQLVRWNLTYSIYRPLLALLDRWHFISLLLNVDYLIEQLNAVTILTMAALVVRHFLLHYACKLICCHYRLSPSIDSLHFIGAYLFSLRKLE